MDTATYAIGLGSNRRGRHGPPERAIVAALAAIGDIVAVSAIIATRPLGPSARRFANAVAMVASRETPPELLARLKGIERDFGRRGGRRWGSRVIDLDILLWSRGAWASPGLVVPHREFRRRAFVLVPLARVAPDWRDPLTGRTVRQSLARLTRRRAVPTAQARW